MNAIATTIQLFVNFKIRQVDIQLLFFFQTVVGFGLRNVSTINSFLSLCTPYANVVLTLFVCKSF